MERIIAFAALGLLLIVMGILNCCGNISSVHWYHRTRVRGEDVLRYGKWIGFGTITFGLALLIALLLGFLFQNAMTDLVLIPGFLLGLVMILYAQFKYNRGLF